MKISHVTLTLADKSTVGGLLVETITGNALSFDRPMLGKVEHHILSTDIKDPANLIASMFSSDENREVVMVKVDDDLATVLYKEDKTVPMLHTPDGAYLPLDTMLTAEVDGRTYTYAAKDFFPVVEVKVDGKYTKNDEINALAIRYGIPYDQFVCLNMAMVFSSKLSTFRSNPPEKLYVNKRGVSTKNDVSTAVAPKYKIADDNTAYVIFTRRY